MTGNRSPSGPPGDPPRGITGRRIPIVLTVLIVLFLVPVLIVAAALMDFARRTRSTFEPGETPPLGVVFTGQFVRTHVGLNLLEQGQFSRLLISGVNPRAGMPIRNFTRQFGLSETLVAALGDGRLTLDEQADNTLENALETRCWVDGAPSGQPIVLITSTLHMPRASLALERALPGRRVERHGVDDEIPVSFRRVADEFLKYMATRVIGLAWRINEHPQRFCRAAATNGQKAPPDSMQSAPRN